MKPFECAVQLLGRASTQGMFVNFTYCYAAQDFPHEKGSGIVSRILTLRLCFSVFARSLTPCKLASDTVLCSASSD